MQSQGSQNHSPHLTVRKAAENNAAMNKEDESGPSNKNSENDPTDSTPENSRSPLSREDKFKKMSNLRQRLGNLISDKDSPGSSPPKRPLVPSNDIKDSPQSAKRTRAQELIAKLRARTEGHINSFTPLNKIGEFKDSSRLQQAGNSFPSQEMIYNPDKFGSNSDSKAVKMSDSSKKDGPKKERKNFPKETVDELKKWFEEHIMHPYPDDSDKELLAEKTGLTTAQVSYWFVNARKRIWQPMLQDKQQASLSGYAKVTAADVMVRGMAQKLKGSPQGLEGLMDLQGGGGSSGEEGEVLGDLISGMAPPGAPIVVNKMALSTNEADSEQERRAEEGSRDTPASER
uniref:Homeobox domain-containing protein n=1 Tax=Guillardia theta TaxID=55529 RepID=A0A7S4JAA0_GUITH|mmetsp:Transcript_14315/g.48959  ORF Transcript_14315/g.48959 Transcript_14315/m.48959 type:complete len:344 (+) Transcript_14315:266-1297(+)